MNWNLEKYYRLQVCILCFDQAENMVCTRCLSDPITCEIIARYKMQLFEREYNTFEAICKDCAGCSLQHLGEVPCENMRCNFYYSKIVARDKVSQITPKLKQVIDALNK